MKVTVLVANSVLACSISTVSGTSWSVLEAIVVTAPFSRRSMVSLFKA